METLKEYLNEVKATSIKVGKTFTLSNDIGKFVKGDQITVKDIKKSGEDVELHMSNQHGDEDVFYIDKNDDFEELIG